MKKKKFSIMLSIATLCLCVAVLAFGVYAAKKASLTTTGSINFEAHNCKVRVLGSVSGAVDNTGAEKTVDKLKDTENDSDGNEQGKLITGDVTWAVGDLYFDDLNCSNDEIATPIVFTFVMTNESDYAVKADLNLIEDLKTNEKITSTATFASEDSLTTSANMCVLNQDQTVTLTLKLVPTTDTKLENINLENIKINFEKTSTSDVVEAQNLTLTYTAQNTATVKMTSSESSVKEVVIPSAVLKSGTTYIVSEIEANAFENNTTITSVTIQEGVKIISASAFRGCTNLSEVIIPNSVTHIKEGAFYGCTSLTHIELPSSVAWIENNAFYGCTNLTSVDIPYGVNQIKMNAFGNCTSLTEVVIPSTVDTIYQSAFAGCENLVSVTLPNNISVINGEAFARCSKLKSIIIPNNVVEIETGTFSYCTSLSEVVIPVSVTSIKIQAFQGCTNLTAVNYQGTKEQWNAISLGDYWCDSTLTQIICTDGTITL